MYALRDPLCEWSDMFKSMNSKRLWFKTLTTIPFLPGICIWIFYPDTEKPLMKTYINKFSSVKFYSHFCHTFLIFMPKHVEATAVAILTVANCLLVHTQCPCHMLLCSNATDSVNPLVISELWDV